MKRLILIVVVASLILTTCGTDVKFKVPQPQCTSELNSIPSTYFGNFQNISDSSLLIIDSFSVRKEWKSTEFIHRDSLEKELKMIIKHDTVIKYRDKLLLDNTSDYFLLNIKIGKDSAKVRIKGYERLFTISDSQVVRSYKKFCFLNFRTKDKYWLVKTLKLNEDSLDYSDLINSKDIENIRDLTKIQIIQDTTKEKKIIEYRLNPTCKELRKILKLKKLENKYIRIK